MRTVITNKPAHFSTTHFGSTFATVLAIALMLVFSSPQTNAQTEPAAQEAEWKVISPTDAHATFLAPKKPRYIERTFTPVANKPPIKVFLYLSTVNKGRETYIFGYHDLHEEPENTIVTARILKGAVRGSVLNVQGQLLSQVTKIRFKQWAGRQFKYQYIQEEKPYVVLARVFIVGKRQYQVNAVALESEFDETRATKFLDSFKLVVVENDEPPVPRNQN